MSNKIKSEFQRPLNLSFCKFKFKSNKIKSEICLTLNFRLSSI